MTNPDSAITGKGRLEWLQFRLVRFSYLGTSSDIAGLFLIDFWGLCRFLSRLVDG